MNWKGERVDIMRVQVSAITMDDAIIEQWIDQRTPHYVCRPHQGTILIGVGAAFDFLAGTKRQAPVWMQRNALEWVFRLLSEPRRLGRRYAVAVPIFIFSPGDKSW